MRILLILAISFFLIAVLPADAQKTTRRGLKTERIVESDSASAIVSDTVFRPGKLIGVYGYEKPLRSNKESVHVANNTEKDVVAIIADIKYLDYQEKEIHRRHIDLKCDIPAGTTRLLTFPSWDMQNRFYYSGGPKPRQQAYPYTVEIQVIGVVTVEQ